MPGRTSSCRRRAVSDKSSKHCEGHHQDSRFKPSSRQCWKTLLCQSATCAKQPSQKARRKYPRRYASKRVIYRGHHQKLWVLQPPVPVASCQSDLSHRGQVCTSHRCSSISHNSWSWWRAIAGFCLFLLTHLAGLEVQALNRSSKMPFLTSITVRHRMRVSASTMITSLSKRS